MPFQYGFQVVHPLVFLASREISLDKAAVKGISFLQATGATPCPEYSVFHTHHAREISQQQTSISQHAYFQTAL